MAAVEIFVDNGDVKHRGFRENVMTLCLFGLEIHLPLIFW